MKHTKMSRQALVDMFTSHKEWAEIQASAPDRRLASAATRKGHKHVVNPSKKPSGASPVIRRRKFLRLQKKGI